MREEEGVYIVFFFSIPWLLIEIIAFVLGAIFCRPVEMGKEVYNNIINWTNNYTGVILIIMAGICIFISVLLGKTVIEKIIYMPTMFLGFWLIYNLIIYGMTDLFSGFDGIWIIFAILSGLMWVLLVFIFIVITIMATIVLPVCIANGIKNIVSRCLIKGFISMVVSAIALWLNFMFSTEFWQPAGKIFISIFGAQ